MIELGKALQEEVRREEERAAAWRDREFTGRAIPSQEKQPAIPSA
jgi:hypothetical protein